MNDNVVKVVDSVTFLVTMCGFGYVILKLAGMCSNHT